MIEPMIPRTTTKRAIDIDRYDTIVDLGMSGIVRNTIVIDNGVQITYIDGTHIVKGEDDPLTVIAKPERSEA